MTVTAPSGSDFAGERRAEFFDDGHLLEREGALKKLAAVQSAAEDEMAFEQRAGVAENLQNFVLRHRGEILSPKSKVQSPKFATETRRHRVLKFFLCVSASLRSNLPRVPKWIKFIIAILLLPVCAGAAKALWLVLRASWRRGHGLGAVAGGRGLLDRDLSAAAQADVGLRVRPRIDARALDVAVRRAGEKNEGHFRRRPRHRFPKPIFSSRSRRIFSRFTRSLVVAVFAIGHLILGLAKLFGLVSSAAWRGVCVSRDVDLARVENAAVGHHVAGLFVFGGDDFSWQRRAYCCSAFRC